MLGRYQMKRGVKREQLPAGLRQDTRKHTRHPLRPGEEMVATYLAAPSAEAWEAFCVAYRALVRERLESQREGFEALAAKAREEAVWLGCSCPTTKNPDVRRCHTWLALEFMREQFPDLEVVFPEP